MSIRSDDSLLINAKPNIVRFVAEVNETMLIEFVTGGSVAELLDSPVLIDQLSVQAVARQSLSALAFIHGQSIVHNDIKPDNLLVGSHNPIQIKLCDFGAAHITDTGVADRKFVGTPAYMAPEFGTKAHSTGVDIWALGVVILNCSGTWPWDPRMDKKRSARIPRYDNLPCASLLDCMFEHDVSRRPKAEKCLESPWLLRNLTASKRRMSDDEEQPHAKRQNTMGSTPTAHATPKASYGNEPNEDAGVDVDTVVGFNVGLLRRAGALAHRFLGLR